MMSIVNSTNLHKKLNDNNQYAQSLSLVTMSSNIVWGALYCVFTTNLTWVCSYVFALPLFLFTLNYGWYEVRIVIKILHLKNSQFLEDTYRFKKTISIYFILLYSVVLVCMIFLLDFLIHPLFVFIATSMLWIPQIIQNLKGNNRLSLPLSSIFSYSFSRVFFIAYFKGTTFNILNLSTDSSIVGIFTTFVLLQILILYSQVLLGAAWFLPSANRKRYMYLELNELTFNKYYSVDGVCIICISRFSESKSAEPSELEFEQNYSKFNLFDDFRHKLKFALFNFHKTTLNIEKKKFVQTDCQHIFHTACLDKWLSHRKECPSCKAPSTIE